jgi:hypothetical protein
MEKKTGTFPWHICKPANPCHGSERYSPQDREGGQKQFQVYPSLTIEHLKRVLMERCLPDNIKDKIQHKRTIKEIWKFLDITFLKPDTFFHGLMQLIAKVKAVLDKDWKVLEEN